jgi:hypothetical protein
MFRDATWPLPVLAVGQLTSAGITRYLFFRSRSEGHFPDDPLWGQTTKYTQIGRVDRSDPRSGSLETLRGGSTYSRYLLLQGASGTRYLAPSSGVLIDEAEILLIGLALDVFDLVANEMHCIHAWWSYAAEEGKGIRIRRIPMLTFHSIAKQAASWSHVSMHVRAHLYVAIPFVFSP